MITVSNLETWYGQIQALRGVSFQVQRGELLAIVGANGVGKSTLLNSIAGLLKPQTGEIRLEGQAIQGLPAEKLVELGISLVPERRQVFPDLTVKDNLLLGAYHRYRQQKQEITGDMENVYRIFPPLQKLADKPAGALSGGEQQMVAIGRGMMSRPKVMLLDEPSLGLAPLVVKEIMGILTYLKTTGVTVLLVEQNARAALKVADRACVLERGRVVYSGAADRLLEDETMQIFYVGKKRQKVAK